MWRHLTCMLGRTKCAPACRFTHPTKPCLRRENGAAAAAGGAGAHRAAAGDELDMERWRRFGLPVPLIAACTACEMGVKRAHLVRARV